MRRFEVCLLISVAVNLLLFPSLMRGLMLPAAGTPPRDRVVVHLTERHTVVAPTPTPRVLATPTPAPVVQATPVPVETLAPPPAATPLPAATPMPVPAAPAATSAPPPGAPAPAPLTASTGAPAKHTVTAPPVNESAPGQVAGVPGGTGTGAPTAAPEATPAPVETPPPPPPPPPPVAMVTPPPPVHPDKLAEPAYQPAPTIPRTMRNASLKTFVSARFEIAADGSCTVILVSSSGDATLDQLTLQTLQQWKWQPATQNGQPIPSSRRVRIDFEVE